MSTLRTHQVLEAYQTLQKELKRPPTIKEIVTTSGVPRSTVRDIIERERLVFSPDLAPLQRGDITMSKPSVRKPTKADRNLLERHCEAADLPFDDVLMWWHKSSEFSILFKEERAIRQLQSLADTLLADMKKKSPRVTTVRKPEGEHLLVLPCADIHMGRYCTSLETGQSYSETEAYASVVAGTKSLVGQAKLFGVKQFVVGIGNDLLHTDNGKTSTAGTPQDTVGTWQSNFRGAYSLMETIILSLVEHANVHLVHVPSNHDWRMGFTLAQAIAARFHNDNRVSTKLMHERHRKYLVFGRNLIGFTHGDGAKEVNLIPLLRREAKRAWAETDFHYLYLGHLHHKIRKQATVKENLEKDQIDFTEIQAVPKLHPTDAPHIEYVRSPAPPDGWHDRNGYVNTPAIEAYLHHPLRGQVARFTHFFE